MAWTERQIAMLAAMGIRLLLPVRSAVDVVAAAEATAETPVETPVEVPVAMPVDGAAVEVSAIVVAPALAAPITRAASPVATLDWQALRDTVATCTACALHTGRTQTVFGVGHPNAQWLIVGEAPGEQEDAQGEPFVGKSGQLLDNMLRAIGLTRDAVDIGADPATRAYIANTVKCRPPGNRNPTPDELQRCEAYLIRQIELLQPKIILAMGRFAIQSLLRSDEPVGKLRGRVHRYNGVPLIVTYHPAYLLRSLEEKARAWDDLCLAVETFKQV